MAMTVPCNGCAERAVGCHASCGRYREYKAECDARREARAGRYVIMDYTVDNITKQRRLEHNRRRK